MAKKVDERGISQQNIKALIDIIRGVVCEKIEIYSINHDEVFKADVGMVSSDDDYFLVLQMNTTFPSDYEMEVKEIGFSLSNLKSATCERVWNENLKLENINYKIKNDKRFELYINIARKLEHMIDIIYVLDTVFPTDSIGSDYCCLMYVVFEFKDTVCAISDDAIKLKMRFKLTNEGKDINRNCKCFRVENRGMKRIE